MSIVQVKGFIPIDITDARFVNSTIAEPDASEPAWNSGTTYAEFNQVSVITADSHLLYESLQSGNVNHPPATSPEWWILKSYTNRFRAFEWNRALPSTGTSPMSAVIRPLKRINTVMLIGIRAAQVVVTVQNGIGGPVVLSITKDLLARHAMTPYEIAFTPFIYDTVFATFDVPPVPDPVITVTLTDPSGTCDLDRFMVGMAVDLGEVDWETVREDENYSSIDYKAGKANFEPAPNMPNLEMVLEIDAYRVNRALQFKEQANGKAVAWSAMHNIPAYSQMHILIGPYQRFRFTTNNHKKSSINLRIRGI